MKFWKRMVMCLAAAAILIGAAGCGGAPGGYPSVLAEVGERIEFGEKVRLAVPGGEETEVSSFTPTEPGDYLIRGSRGTGVIKVLKAEAPSITLTERAENVLWRTGRTYRVPEAVAHDNTDPSPRLETKVFDSSDNEVAIADNGSLRVSVAESEYFRVEFTATDRAGNSATEEMRIYATGESEISSFETLSLMNGFFATDDNKNDESRYSLRYNEDAATNLEGSRGNLELTLKLREVTDIDVSSTAWPGICIEGTSLPVSDISAEKYQGIRFDVMIASDREYQLNASIFSSDAAHPENPYFIQSRVIFDARQGTGLSPNEWHTVTLTKEQILAHSSAMDLYGNRVFDFSAITRFKIWGLDVIAGTPGEETEVRIFVDNVKYLIGE